MMVFWQQQGAVTQEIQVLSITLGQDSHNVVKSELFQLPIYIMR